ncbi:HAMP domain-containing histidine kinase [bacterium]|uniref:histidine kinase n=2 Tax=Katanobacteria TaxID=422282 RepID=A0A2M7X103_UNCKA|nr:HAMP domain-containing histidine kinase [bacterium]PIP56066.1 MAG: hypothetical protein COX05_05060 [candidate division WWE3 bacterium CG22_combo_CG10-13_8_21_14_all_39_12]PJA39847.1 MAG: hypothetical protein CO179_04250 [candidate division WWE3 bacterium CG_4_9_14_3_um_filter_39_7]
MFLITLVTLGAYEIREGVRRREEASLLQFETSTKSYEAIFNNFFEREATESEVNSFNDLIGTVNNSPDSFVGYYFSDWFPSLQSTQLPISSVLNQSQDNYFTQNIHIVSVDGSDYLMRYFPSLSPQLYGVVIQKSQVRQTGIGQIAISFIFALGILGIVTIATTWFMRRVIIKPVQKVETVADEIARGNFESRTELVSGDEIGRLSNSVNIMAQKLGEYVGKLEKVDEVKDEFIALASHNLRTPITKLKGGLEILSEEGHSSAVTTTILQLKDTTYELDRLTERLLSVVSIETRETTYVDVVAIDVYALLRKAVEHISARAGDRNITVQLHKSVTTGTVSGVSSRLLEAFEYILDNAVTFNKDGGKVDVHVESTLQDVMVKIVDTGVGIEKEILPRLFSKFERGQNMLSGDYPGVGLGLYVTKLIIDQHGGRISIDSIKGEGTTVIIVLPLEIEKEG